MLLLLDGAKIRGNYVQPREGRIYLTFGERGRIILNYNTILLILSQGVEHKVLNFLKSHGMQRIVNIKIIAIRRFYGN